VTLGKKELPHCTAYSLLACSDMLTLQCSAFTWLLFMCSVCTKHLLAKPKKISRELSECAAFAFIYTTLHSSQNDTCGRFHVHGSSKVQVGTITGLDYGTTGLTQTAKYNSFSAEQKLKVLIP